MKTGRLAFIVVLVLLFLGTVVPAQADNGTAGTELSPIVFTDTTSYDHFHVDDTPHKGFFWLWTQNSTGTAWSGFNFTVSGSNAVFIDTALWDADNPADPCSSWAYDPNCDPLSSYGISSWSIASDQKSMSVTLNSTWDAGQTGWVRVYTDNTASPSGNFTVSVAPVLVPEPISSTLFIIGGATLGFRRFRKSRKA